MYDELIEQLRETSIDFGESDYVSVMLIEAANAIEDLIAALTASNKVIAKNKLKWIPVTERLPEDRQRVLAIEPLLTKPKTTYYRIVYFSDNLESVDSLEFDGKNRCGFYYYDSDYGFCEVDGITHWMPLPQPPESEGE